MTYTGTAFQRRMAHCSMVPNPHHMHTPLKPDWLHLLFACLMDHHSLIGNIWHDTSQETCSQASVCSAGRCPGNTQHSASKGAGFGQQQPHGRCACFPGEECGPRHAEDLVGGTLLLKTQIRLHCSHVACEMVCSTVLPSPDVC